MSHESPLSSINRLDRTRIVAEERREVKQYLAAGWTLNTEFAPSLQIRALDEFKSPDRPRTRSRHSSSERAEWPRLRNMLPGLASTSCRGRPTCLGPTSENFDQQIRAIEAI